MDNTTAGVVVNQLAELQCDPHVQDFSDIGLLHVFGGGVIPQSHYVVSLFDAACGDVESPACYSQPLDVHTGRWGDTVPPFNDDPSGFFQPDIADVAAIVRKFVGELEPSRQIADLEPHILNVDQKIDFRDIATGVSAIIFEPYPFDGPGACP